MACRVTVGRSSPSQSAIIRLNASSAIQKTTESELLVIFTNRGTSLEGRVPKVLSGMVRLGVISALSIAGHPSVKHVGLNYSFHIPPLALNESKGMACARDRLKGGTETTV